MISLGIHCLCQCAVLNFVNSLPVLDGLCKLAEEHLSCFKSPTQIGAEASKTPFWRLFRLEGVES